MVGSAPASTTAPQCGQKGVCCESDFPQEGQEDVNTRGGVYCVQTCIAPSIHFSSIHCLIDQMRQSNRSLDRWIDGSIQGLESLQQCAAQTRECLPMHVPDAAALDELDHV